MCKVEETLMGFYGLATKLRKVVAQFPATVFGSKHKGNVQEIDIVVKGRRHCSTTLPSMGPCKNVLKSPFALARRWRSRRITRHCSSSW